MRCDAMSYVMNSQMFHTLVKCILLNSCDSVVSCFV